VKRHYEHTNKWGFIDQLVNIDTIETVHEQMNDELMTAECDVMTDGNAPDTQPEYGNEDGITSGKMVDNLVDETLGQQYHIARDQANKVYLPEFLKDPQNITDPAFKVCTISMVAVHVGA
jgi:hypothetical protein